MVGIGSLYPARMPVPMGYPGSYGVYPQPYARPYGAIGFGASEKPPTPPAQPAAPAAAPGAEVPPTAARPYGMEESYIENILRMNLGKIGTFYMTYQGNPEWTARIFKGKVEAAGRDHIIISDPDTGRRFLLLMVNLDYVTFDEPLNYAYPYASAPRPRFR